VVELIDRSAHDPTVRRDLPSGTVTFLFTDIESSTKLLDELGTAEYAVALAEHRQVVRDICGEHDGVEVDTQGDAFFMAFATAPAALDAAREIVDRLGSGPVRVRLGLHTGTPLVTDEGYVGHDVHRAARIAASGYGDQVLVSSATRALVSDDGRLRDLGEHRFKDLGAPERVFQLGEGDFPPLRSLYRTNLPVPASSFLGRRAELDEVTGLLDADDVRLLTLTGPGGTGKTRLAMHAAADSADAFPDGIWWIPLASLLSAHHVTTSLAQALSAEKLPGVDLAQSVAARLEGRSALLLLDNAEHLLPDVAHEIARLRDIPGPKIIVTSRERLRLQGERVYAVPPLARQDGVNLFVTRAHAVASDVGSPHAVKELCSRLDNLPLALELAAARTIVFSPEQLLERLSERLDLLQGGRDADPRQQTLRATIEWSHGLLDDAEQGLFRRLSVFAGGCTYDAAETVAAATPDTLLSLVDKNLVRRRDLEPPRFWMLETIRELAIERLAAVRETADLRRRHAAHYLDVARASNLDADRVGPQRHDLVIPERDNMRAVLAWALETGERNVGLELLVSLENYWATSAPEEGLEWAAALLRERSDADEHLVARALRVQGGMQNAVGQLDASEKSWAEALEIVRRLGDERGVAVLLHRFSNTAMRRGDVARARELAEESLAGHRRVGRFPKGEAQALSSLAWVARREGDFDRALELLAESGQLADEVGFRWWLTGVLAQSGEVLAELGRHDEASVRVQQALTMSRTMNDRFGVVYEVRLLAELAAAEGDMRRGGVLLGATEAEHERAPVGPWIHGSAKPSHLLEVDDPEFVGGRAEGRQLSLDEAVALALEGAPSTT
jgi:predicted ATPase/class 3 adenylate cyclase